MKKILFLSTGGTIASSQSDEGLKPSLTGKELLAYLGKQEQFEVVCEDLLNLDSSNIQPEEWQIIARKIAQCYHAYDGIVLSHGTDTMAYTASALSFMLQNLPIPLMVTGSQLPLTHPLSDGIDNIRTAFQAALHTALRGVYICFHHKVMLGVRTVKVRTMSFDAFESVNMDPVGIVDARGLHIQKDLIVTCNGKFELDDTLHTNIFLMKLMPGMNPDIFDILLQMGYKGIVIEAFGAGGINFIRRDLIQKLDQIVKKGMSVVVCSQCLYENSNLSIYQTGQKALRQGVIEGHDMTSEAAVTKLMWALGKTKNPFEVKQLFQTNYVNEITLLNQS